MDDASVDVGDYVDRYLDRIGFDREIAIDVETLAALQLAHLTHVPFENLDVYRGERVRTDLAWSLPKVVDRGRGGWCFELNGAFAALLGELGFDVTMLGAAVLLAGPTTVIDHLTIEVALDEPHLVDVGFGDSFIRPLLLNKRGPQDGGTGTFEFIDSAEGLTLTKHDEGGVPVPQFRFKRVHHELADFESASDDLQSDRSLHWSEKPFATRLVDHGPDRITLLGDRLKTTSDGTVHEEPVSAEQWPEELSTYFGMSVDGMPTYSDERND